LEKFCEYQSICITATRAIYFSFSDYLQKEHLVIAQKIASIAQDIFEDTLRSNQKIVIEYVAFDHDHSSSFDMYKILLRKYFFGLRVPFVYTNLAYYTATNPPQISVFSKKLYLPLLPTQTKPSIFKNFKFVIRFP